MPSIRALNGTRQVMDCADLYPAGKLLSSPGAFSMFRACASTRIKAQTTVDKCARPGRSEEAKLNVAEMSGLHTQAEIKPVQLNFDI